MSYPDHFLRSKLATVVNDDRRLTISSSMTTRLEGWNEQLEVGKNASSSFSRYQLVNYCRLGLEGHFEVFGLFKMTKTKKPDGTTYF